MSSYYFNAHQQHPTPAAASAISHSHHGGRNRGKGPRLSVSQTTHKQFRGVKSMKELTDSVNVTSFRSKFESAMSFDLEDDMEFCPNLLTESDLVSIHSSSSERSSLASESPQGSPTQHPTTIATQFSLNSSSPPFVPPALHQQLSTLKLHQPAARHRNAIPIINPHTGITLPSPPPSVSPARMQQQAIRAGGRW